MANNIPDFQPVRISRASQEIVEQIKQAILNGQLTVGQRLPSERDMAEQFGVSRITLRDAIRTLEAYGLVEVRVGAAGGIFVRSPDPQQFTESLITLIRLGQTSLDALVEARKVVETAIAELAAQRATPDDLAAMEQALAEAREAAAAGDPHFSPYSVAFHTALARAAKNPVLMFTVDSFRSLFYQVLNKMPPSAGMGERALQDHQLIYEAVKNRDPKRAGELMLEHLAYFERALHNLQVNHL